jgi:hypothetical protein
MTGTFKLQENFPALKKSSSNQCCGLFRISDVYPGSKNNKRTKEGKGKI